MGEALPQLGLLVPLQSNNSNEGVNFLILLVPVVQQNWAVGIITMKKSKGFTMMMNNKEVPSLLIVVQQN
jgi:hypothetical protein